MGTAFLYGNGGSGGTGATLTITAPAGCTVTVSKDGKTKTKTAGAGGTAVFKGLETGTWTVTITDGGQQASKSVTVTADYATSITFFAATIHITYPAGSVCTATDGITTLTAPDTSGTWECVVPNAGTWTVSNNGNSVAKHVDVMTSDDEFTINLCKIYLFNGSEKTGISETHITGGLETISTIYAWDGDTQTASLPSVSIAADKSYFNISITGNRGGYHAVNMIDLTGSSKMYITGTVQSWGQHSFCAEQVRPSKTSVFAAQAAFSNTSGLQTVCLDISELSGLYDVAICIRNGSGSATTALRIYDWWIE